jgi:hypothetical protein
MKQNTLNIRQEEGFIEPKETYNKLKKLLTGIGTVQSIIQQKIQTFETIEKLYPKD